MSLDKGIKSGKERRKQYFGVKASCQMCRNHGSCAYCRGNRLYKNTKRLARFNDLRKELDITAEQNDEGKIEGDKKIEI